MRHVALLLLWPLAAATQSLKPEELSNIEGRVLNAATGDPVGKVALFLMRAGAAPEPSDWSRSYGATSDSTGNFAIRNIDPGKYRLKASRNGFITIEYGARVSQRSGTVFDLERPQQLRDVDVRSTPHGVISGRVLDIDAEPMANVQVQLLRSRYVNPKKVLATTNTTYTNDLGEYRWSGLTPGKYYLCAVHSEGLPPTSSVPEEYVRVYYPVATDVTGAVPLDVAAGAQVRAGDMMMRKSRTATAKGRVVVMLENTRGTPSVRFDPRSGHDNSAATSYRGFTGKVNASGEFEVRGLTPGSYTAQASIAKEGLSYAGWVTVQVSGTDLEGVVITIGNVVSMTGRIRVEGDSTPDLARLRIMLLPGGPATAPSSSSSWTSRITPDRTFKSDNLDPNLHGIVITGLPDGFYVKRIRAGEADVTYSGVDLTSGSPGNVDILLSPKAGLVSVATQKPNTSQSPAGATLVLVPKEPERLSIFTFYQQGTTDQFGRFTFKNVVPGEYTVYAWEDVESSAWMDPDFMKPLEGKGESVTVAESAQAKIQVTIIPADSEKEKPK